MFNLLSVSSIAQEKDSLKQLSHEKRLIGRFYFSKKYTTLQFKSDDHQTFKYRPSTTLNMGVGATYKWATLNLAYGFDFLNPNRKTKGNTQYLDLQFHTTFSNKFIIDGFGEFYRGFATKLEKNEPYYLRPDIRVNVVGAEIMKVMNNNHFDIRPPTMSHYINQYSGYSILLGSEIIVGSIMGDSSLVPVRLGTDPSFSYDKVFFTKIAPSIGVGFKLVILKHFILDGGVSTALALGYTKTDFTNGNTFTEFYFKPDFNIRLFAGIMLGNWNIGCSLFNQRTRFLSNNKNSSINMDIGNMRFVISYRINHN
ncbi:DUF4421 family protein [Marinigracilibium pacificum]|uniref:DUF4421 domain-containing protein n=1 Tax=Marinigracilibium pacificum TaxID=2729599 RepID=A0A848IYJ7_9BACT|nr:DUF4421 family protein [Marinigracilibium pacificum]NMM48238.1 DUF4421 domain-containing protein [Marinigracilibium pacificum]